MSAFLAPCVIAVLVWWSTTGFILFLNTRASSTFRWSFLGAGALALAAFGGLLAGAGDATARGAYTAFACAILLWAWLEAGFLMGFIAGPRKHACPEGCSGRQHFFHAAQAVVYNDAATAAVIAAVWAGTRNAENLVGLWTLLILWVMRISAKLNLFLGVPNLGEAFLPAHLQYLRSFFRRRPMNFLFPISVTAGTLGGGALLWALHSSRDVFSITAIALLFTLLALALLEHWFMVLPLPSERLWSWAVHGEARRNRGRHTPKAMLASDSVRSIHRPPRSVRRTSAS